MDDFENINILVAGYPGVGKTTYLAALWYVLTNSDEIHSKIITPILDGDDTYLNRITRDWVSYNAVDRTKMSQEKNVSIKIKDNETNSIFRLSFPDLSGERFRLQFEDRQYTEDYSNIVRASKGYLIFIHSGRIKKPNKIIDAYDTMTQIAANFDPLQNSDSNSEVEENSNDWDYSLCPTQVMYVELIQFLKHIVDSPNPLRLAIILSAWDIVMNHARSPVNFISKQLPLLYQFLQANKDSFQVKIYGVSSQGIDLSDLEAVKTFAASNIKATERIIVCEDNSSNVSHDITKPIKWIIDI